MESIKWIKICTDIFDDEKICLIEGMPNADGIIVCWFKLLCMAGKQNNNGVFMFNKIAYTDEMLATIFHRPVELVSKALDVFVSFGMVEIVNNAYTIPNWDKHQKLDAMEAAKEKSRKRVAAFRAKQKELANGSDCKNVTAAADKEKGFSPPTLEQVKRHCEAQGYYCVDAERFYSYYIANGWKMGSYSMQSWEAALYNWEIGDRRKTKDVQAQLCGGYDGEITEAERTKNLQKFEEMFGKDAGF